MTSATPQPVSQTPLPPRGKKERLASVEPNGAASRVMRGTPVRMASQSACFASKQCLTDPQNKSELTKETNLYWNTSREPAGFAK